jgi:hypothetical protein
MRWRLFVSNKVNMNVRLSQPNSFSVSERQIRRRLLLNKLVSEPAITKGWSPPVQQYKNGHNPKKFRLPHFLIIYSARLIWVLTSCPRNRIHVSRMTHTTIRHDCKPVPSTAYFMVISVALYVTLNVAGSKSPKPLLPMSAVEHEPENVPNIRHTAVSSRNIRLDFTYWLFYRRFKGFVD